MLFASDISKSYSDRTLFSGLSLSLAAGDRVALIGANGSGKTTLMDILAGDAAPETGSISKRRNVTVGYLKQEPASFADRPLLEEVLDAGSEVNALTDEIAATQEALSSETDPAKQGDLLERLSQLDVALEAAGGEDRDHEAKAILSGLGFKQSDFPRPMGEFSGGWAMRAGLARMLFRKPDLLLLDEPTNHLDLGGKPVVREVPVIVQWRGAHHIPRPRFPEPGGNQGSRHRAGRGGAPERQLRPLPGSTRALPGDKAGGQGEAGARGTEADALHSWNAFAPRRGRPPRCKAD